MSTTRTRPARRHVVTSAAVVAIAAGLLAPTGASASPTATATNTNAGARVAAAAATCTAAAHENRNGGTAQVIAGRSARSSYYEECTERFTGGAVSLHCWQLNKRNNIWWFAKDRSGAQGWVFIDNFVSRPGAPADKQCPGALVDPPA